MILVEAGPSFLETKVLSQSRYHLRPWWEKLSRAIVSKLCEARFLLWVCRERLGPLDGQAITEL